MSSEIRKALLASLRAALLQKQPQENYAAATDAAVLLDRMSLEDARQHARAMARHLDAVWNEENEPMKPDELDQREHEEERTEAR
jgi:hypothetical protein